MKAPRGAALAAVIVAVSIAAGLSLRSPKKPRGLVSNKSLVCMVNDRVMGHPQIPVPVDGKTYYGCCADCVGRLKSDRRARTAIDPVSGREVDKSQAVILKGDAGRALYFETVESARSYSPAGARADGS